MHLVHVPRSAYKITLGAKTPLPEQIMAASSPARSGDTTIMDDDMVLPVVDRPEGYWLEHKTMNMPANVRAMFNVSKDDAKYKPSIRSANKVCPPRGPRTHSISRSISHTHHPALKEGLFTFRMEDIKKAVFHDDKPTTGYLSLQSAKYTFGDPVHLPAHLNEQYFHAGDTWHTCYFPDDHPVTIVAIETNGDGDGKKA